MFCKNCGSENLDSAKFCKNCGESLFYDQDQNCQNTAEFMVSQNRRRWKWLIGLVVLLIILATGIVYSVVLKGDWKSLSSFLTNGPTAIPEPKIEDIFGIPLIQDSMKDQLPTTPADNVDTTTEFVCGTSQVNDFDGNIYGTVLVGTQCWMSSNLNVGERLASDDEPSDNNKIEKWCYDDDESNCDSDGGLYSWDEAMQYSTSEGEQGICPNGWHLPDTSELDNLEKELTSNNVNFVLPGFYYNGEYHDGGESINLWSTEEVGSDRANDMLVYSNKNKLSDDSSLKKNGFSVCCVKDNYIRSFKY